MPSELLEAREQSFLADLRAAVEVYAHLTMLVRDGRYDEQAAPRVRATVFVDADGQKRMVRGGGFREMGPGPASGDEVNPGPDPRRT